MTNREFFAWLADRLVNVYGESPNVDFVLHLRQIADGKIHHDGTKVVRVPWDCQ